MKVRFISRRILVLVLSLILLMSAGAFSASAAYLFSSNADSASNGYEDEILFNNIPWGTAYSEVISSLQELYKVSFTDPEYQTVKPKMALDHLPFSLATSFTVRSKKAVTVADSKAYIVLDFVFPNDRKTVANHDANQAILTKATYYFWVNKHDADASNYPEVANKTHDEASELAHDLALKLASIYGGSESHRLSLGWEEYYRISGANNSGVRFGFGMQSVKYGFIYLEMIYTGMNDTTDLIKENGELLNKQVEAEYLRRAEEQKKQQEEHDAQIIQGDKSGL